MAMDSARTPSPLGGFPVTEPHLAAKDQLRRQWLQPTGIMAVLLLVGGDIVNKALGQLAGSVLTPVTFSFGIVTR